MRGGEERREREPALACRGEELDVVVVRRYFMVYPARGAQEVFRLEEAYFVDPDEHGVDPALYPARARYADDEQEGTAADEEHDVACVPAQVGIFLKQVGLGDHRERDDHREKEEHLQRAHERYRDGLPHRHAVPVEQVDLEGAAAALHRRDGAAEVVYPDDGERAAQRQFFAGGARERHELEGVKEPHEYDERRRAREKRRVRVAEHREGRSVYAAEQHADYRQYDDYDKYRKALFNAHSVLPKTKRDGKAAAHLIILA